MPSRRADSVFPTFNALSWVHDNIWIIIASAIIIAWCLIGHYMADLSTYNLTVETVGCALCFGLPCMGIILLAREMYQRWHVIKMPKASMIMVFSIVIAGWMLCMHLTMSVRLARLKSEFTTAAVANDNIKIHQIIKERDDFAKSKGFHVLPGWQTDKSINGADVYSVYLWDPIMYFQKE